MVCVRVTYFQHFEREPGKVIAAVDVGQAVLEYHYQVVYEVGHAAVGLELNWVDQIVAVSQQVFVETIDFGYQL